MAHPPDITPEAFSDLIGRIYDAALDPALWPDVLWRSAGFVDAQAAGLLSKGLVSGAGSVHYQVGVDDRFIRLYESEFFRFDPMAPLVLFDVGEVTARLDYIPDDEFYEGRFHREWAAPQGWIDAANAVIEKSAAIFSILSFLRSNEAGRVDDEMRRRVGLVFPHIRRAVLIGQTIDLRTAEAAELAEALDGLQSGFFLIAGGGRMVHANRRGHAMIADGILAARGGRLMADDMAMQRQLDHAVAAAAAGDTAIGTDGIALPFMAGGERYVAHVLPLAAGARREVAARHAAVAAMFVRRAALPTPSAVEVVAKSFALTPAEARVLIAMTEADSVATIATALGVSENTVNTHLRHLFSKTGRRRQADLVKLLAESESPLRV